MLSSNEVEEVVGSIYDLFYSYADVRMTSDESEILWDKLVDVISGAVNE